MTKPIELDVVPVEQEPVGVAVGKLGLLNNAVPIGTKLYTHPSADQSAEIAKLIQAVADHVTVRAEQCQRIKNLKARAHDHLALLGAERNRALKAEQERDTMRNQVQVLVNHLDPICKSIPRTQRQSELFEQARAALAAVREPAPIDHAILDNPIYETRSPENDIYKQCPWKPVKQEGVPISALAAVREPADHIEHDLEKVRGPTISPAGEGGDRG